MNEEAWRGFAVGMLIGGGLVGLLYTTVFLLVSPKEWFKKREET